MFVLTGTRGIFKPRSSVWNGALSSSIPPLWTAPSRASRKNSETSPIINIRRTCTTRLARVEWRASRAVEHVAGNETGSSLAAALRNVGGFLDTQRQHRGTYGIKK